MSAKIIDGKRIAEEFRREVRAGTDALERRGLRRPGLAVVMVGNNAASAVYVRNKRRACEETGIVSVAHDLPESTTGGELLSLIDRLNADPAIDGILVQLPLPAHIASVEVLERIDPSKDVDGFHPYNVGRLVQQMPIHAALHSLRDHPDDGACRPRDKRPQCGHRRPEQHRGPPDGTRTAHEGGDHHRLPQPAPATCPARSARPEFSSRPVGKPQFVPGSWIRPGAVVIDVGINRLPDGRLVGDVQFDEAAKRAGHITPVPGGVGPMTIAALMKNTLESAERRFGK